MIATATFISTTIVINDASSKSVDAAADYSLGDPDREA